MSGTGGEATYNLQDASVSDLSTWLQEVGRILARLIRVENTLAWLIRVENTLAWLISVENTLAWLIRVENTLAWLIRVKNTGMVENSREDIVNVDKSILPTVLCNDIWWLFTFFWLQDQSVPSC